MRVMNTDAKSHSEKTPEECLQDAERVKKKIYVNACLQQRINFYLFVSSVDGMLGVEATATLKRLASFLAIKWWQHYYRTCGYVKSRIRHHFGAGHTPVHPGVQVYGAQDKRPAPAVGRWRRDQPIQVSATWDPMSKQSLHLTPKP